ncbi:hypothetical protein SUGI_1185190 [Cryptomeria japonica]|nr:hypothetical protein SUGI_1185190 [Cryptomeria japonica]
MPFNVWCGDYQSMIAKGVQLNAEKNCTVHLKQIWRLSIKTVCCKQDVVIQTDPRNCQYIIISGAERKKEEFDMKDAEIFTVPAEELGKLVDPFYRLEHQGEY